MGCGQAKSAQIRPEDFEELERRLQVVAQHQRQAWADSLDPVKPIAEVQTKLEEPLPTNVVDENPPETKVVVEDAPHLVKAALAHRVEWETWAERLGSSDTLHAPPGAPSLAELEVEGLPGCRVAKELREIRELARRCFTHRVAADCQAAGVSTPLDVWLGILRTVGIEEKDVSRIGPVSGKCVPCSSVDGCVVFGCGEEVKDLMDHRLNSCILRPVVRGAFEPAQGADCADGHPFVQGCGRCVKFSELKGHRETGCVALASCRFVSLPNDRRWSTDSADPFLFPSGAKRREALRAYFDQDRALRAGGRCIHCRSWLAGKLPRAERKSGTWTQTSWACQKCCATGKQKTKSLSEMLRGSAAEQDATVVEAFLGGEVNNSPEDLQAHATNKNSEHDDWMDASEELIAGVVESRNRRRRLGVSEHNLARLLRTFLAKFDDVTLATSKAVLWNRLRPNAPIFCASLARLAVDSGDSLSAESCFHRVLRVAAHLEAVEVLERTRVERERALRATRLNDLAHLTAQASAEAETGHSSCLRRVGLWLPSRGAFPKLALALSLADECKLSQEAAFGEAVEVMERLCPVDCPLMPCRWVGRAECLAGHLEAHAKRHMSELEGQMREAEERKAKMLAEATATLKENQATAQALKQDAESLLPPPENLCRWSNRWSRVCDGGKFKVKLVECSRTIDRWQQQHSLITAFTNLQDAVYHGSSLGVDETLLENAAVILAQSKPARCPKPWCTWLGEEVHLPGHIIAHENSLQLDRAAELKRVAAEREATTSDAAAKLELALVAVKGVGAPCLTGKTSDPGVQCETDAPCFLPLADLRRFVGRWEWVSDGNKRTLAPKASPLSSDAWRRRRSLVTAYDRLEAAVLRGGEVDVDENTLEAASRVLLERPVCCPKPSCLWFGCSAGLEEHVEEHERSVVRWRAEEMERRVQVRRQEAVDSLLALQSVMDSVPRQSTSASDLPVVDLRRRRRQWRPVDMDRSTESRLNGFDFYSDDWSASAGPFSALLDALNTAQAVQPTGEVCDPCDLLGQAERLLFEESPCSCRVPSCGWRGPRKERWRHAEAHRADLAQCHEAQIEARRLARRASEEASALDDDRVLRDVAELQARWDASVKSGCVEAESSACREDGERKQMCLEDWSSRMWAMEEAT